SHDIRNPIGVIQGYASILREGELSETEMQDCVRRLESAAATAMLLATNVLYAARLEGGAARPRREPVQVADVLDRALDGQRLLVDNKRIRLAMDVGENLPAFEGDVNELERVFANLLNNAIKFTPEGREIRVRAAAENGAIAVDFEDEGEGIPPGCEESIFDRFNESSNRRDSTGLGLYISRSIVTAHGGRIHAENRPSGGARFVVRLPIG
ncbi:MAG: sensor histidine kinase, partial [Candidatus Binatia bacterium]